MSSSSGTLRSGSGDKVVSEEEQEVEEDEEEEQPSGNGRTPVGSVSTLAPNSPPAVTPQTQNSRLLHWTSNSDGETEILRQCGAASDKCLREHSPNV